MAHRQYIIVNDATGWYLQITGSMRNATNSIKSATRFPSYERASPYLRPGWTARLVSREVGLPDVPLDTVFIPRDLAWNAINTLNGAANFYANIATSSPVFREAVGYELAEKTCRDLAHKFSKALKND